MQKLCFILISLLSSFCWAERFQGFVEIQAHRALYVDFQKAAAGQPTLVLLNGLTYSTKYWDAFTEKAVKLGMGVLRYDPAGMGATLEKSGPITKVIRIEDQARDIDLLTRKVGLKGKLNIVGLSYGGGLAIAFAEKYAARIGNAILMAPFTEPVASQDKSIRDQILATRIAAPFNTASDEDLYAFFLRQNVYVAYPLTEPSMYDSPLKSEAVFQMIQGIRKYDMKGATQLFPARSVHLMIAGNDQYIERKVLETYWAEIVPEESRASKIIVEESEHKMPEAQPAFAAAWISKILRGEAYLFDGSAFHGTPSTGKITRD